MCESSGTMVLFSQSAQSCSNFKQQLPWRKKEDVALEQLQMIHGSNWSLITDRLNFLNQSEGIHLKRSALEVQQRFNTFFQNNKENCPDLSTFRDSLYVVVFSLYVCFNDMCNNAYLFEIDVVLSLVYEFFNI